MSFACADCHTSSIFFHAILIRRVAWSTLPKKTHTLTPRRETENDGGSAVAGPECRFERNGNLPCPALRVLSLDRPHIVELLLQYPSKSVEAPFEPTYTAKTWTKRPPPPAPTLLPRASTAPGTKRKQPWTRDTCDDFSRSLNGHTSRRMKLQTAHTPLLKQEVERAHAGEACREPPLVQLIRVPITAGRPPPPLGPLDHMKPAEPQRAAPRHEAMRANLMVGEQVATMTKIPTERSLSALSTKATREMVK